MMAWAARGWLRFFSLLLVCAFAAALLALAREGPDFGRYLDWAQAFSHNDIFALPGAILSPNQVPLTQWFHGTGLIFSLPQSLSGQRLDVIPAALVAGSLAGLAFWWAMSRLLLLAAGGSLPLTLFGMGAAFIGTHAGFYSHTHGSESFAYAFSAMLALSLLSSSRWRIHDALAGGAAAALLIELRPNLAYWVLPAIVLLAARAIAARGTAGNTKVGLALGWLFLTTSVAVLQAGLVNRWMTGNWLQSPYLFGGNGFHSIELARPQFLAVVGHPWHGLLTYHPLYAIGFAALIALVYRSHSRSERIAWLALGSLVLIQLYIQASWYVWWLGTGTFGQRGMALAAVILIPALVTVIKRDQSERGRGRIVWILLTLATCLWSYLLLLQRESNLQTYRQLMAAQLEQLVQLAQIGTLVPLLGGLILPGIFVVGLRRCRQTKPDSLLVWAAGVMLVLSFSYLGLSLAGVSAEWITQFGPVAVAAALAAAVFAFWAIGRRGGQAARQDWPSTATAVAMVALFLATTAQFGRLALRTEQHIAARVPPPRAMVCTSSVMWDEVEASYQEYLGLSGFERQKAALHLFLARTGAEECPQLALP